VGCVVVPESIFLWIFGFRDVAPHLCFVQRLSGHIVRLGYFELKVYGYRFRGSTAFSFVEMCGRVVGLLDRLAVAGLCVIALFRFAL
jgi:hypothetical protein